MGLYSKYEFCKMDNKWKNKYIRCVNEFSKLLKMEWDDFFNNFQLCCENSVNLETIKDAYDSSTTIKTLFEDQQQKSMVTMDKFITDFNLWLRNHLIQLDCHDVITVDLDDDDDDDDVVMITNDDDDIIVIDDDDDDDKSFNIVTKDSSVVYNKKLVQKSLIETLKNNSEESSSKSNLEFNNVSCTDNNVSSIVSIENETCPKSNSQVDISLTNVTESNFNDSIENNNVLDSAVEKSNTNKSQEMILNNDSELNSNVSDSMNQEENSVATKVINNPEEDQILNNDLELSSNDSPAVSSVSNSIDREENSVATKVIDNPEEDQILNNDLELSSDDSSAVSSESNSIDREESVTKKVTNESEENPILNNDLELSSDDSSAVSSESDSIDREESDATKVVDMPEEDPIFNNNLDINLNNLTVTKSISNSVIQENSINKTLESEKEIISCDYSELICNNLIVSNKVSDAKKKDAKSIEDKEFERLINLDSLEKKRRYSSESLDDNDYSLELKKKTCAPKKKKIKLSAIEESSNDDNDSSKSDSDGISDAEQNTNLITNLPNSNLSSSSSNDDFDDSTEDLDSSDDNDGSSNSAINKKTSKKKEQNFDQSNSSDDDDDDNSNEKKEKKKKYLQDDILRFKLSDDEDSNKLNKKGNSSARDVKKIQTGCAKRKQTLHRNKSFDDFFDEELTFEIASIPNDEYKKNDYQKTKNKKPDANKALKTNSKKTGRRNIKKVIADEQMAPDTKKANESEDNRMQRLKERKKQLEIIFNEEKFKEKGFFVLDVDLNTREKLVVVDKGLAKHLKPHQEEGVRFMWDSCFESLEQVAISEGTGCILGHCMGLGKTFQVITLIHTVLNKNMDIKTVMVLCPKNTVLNWQDEFEMWLTHVENKNSKDVKVYNLSRATSTYSRIEIFNSWQEQGGVLLISYSLICELLFGTRQTYSQEEEIDINDFLINPGADFVVADEGHLLKSDKTKISQIMNRIRTKRRIILTGTPFQNNLEEYYCMICFIKPNLLGDKWEFRNRFNNPIINGQYSDSTSEDLNLMKKRAHVLHTLVENSLQRKEFSCLEALLPPKKEYAIFIRLSKTQEEMYKYFLNNVVGKKSNLLSNYHLIQQLICHPKILENKLRNKIDCDPWWRLFINAYDLESYEVSHKMMIFFAILKRCEEEGDKLLVFSQSVLALDLIEEFFYKINNKQVRDLFDFQGKWKQNIDYYRIDGKTTVLSRRKYCRKFNNPLEKQSRLFLISSKAGGIGINLIGANRVVIFDPSWNPADDEQSIFRIYRFGQCKPCYVYRLLTDGTMEQKIYHRQVTKLSLGLRVLDEKQIERHYRNNDLNKLYSYELSSVSTVNLPKPKDRILADVLLHYEKYIGSFVEQELLLKNKEDEKLDEDERKQALVEYEQEKITNLQRKRYAPNNTETTDVIATNNENENLVTNTEEKTGE